VKCSILAGSLSNSIIRETIVAAHASASDSPREFKWDNHMWVYLFNGCFDQVVSLSSLPSFAKNTGAVYPLTQPALFYLDAHMARDPQDYADERLKLFKLMQAELIRRLSHGTKTLVLGMMTQGACLLRAPAVGGALFSA
jgi:hypothetical protein